LPVQADQLQLGMLWQVAWSVAPLQGPLQTPFDQLQPVTTRFTRQSFCVVAVGQSRPLTGFTKHPGAAAQPGTF
jgi:hypothetical protein